MVICSKYIIFNFQVDPSFDDILGELGISFTSSVEKCRGHLSQLVGRDLKHSDMARILIVMLKSRGVVEYWQDADSSKEKSQDPSHVPSPWSVENLVQAARELVG